MSFNPVARFVQGDPLMVDFSSTNNYNAGDVVIVAGKLGIMHNDYTAATVNSGNNIGAISEGRAVYDFQKNASDSWNDRVAVYFNSTSSKLDSALTATNGGYGSITALGAAATGNTVARVVVASQF